MEIEIISKTLKEFRTSLSLLSNTDFTSRILGLSGGTIGEHTRHIIELFNCLHTGYDAGVINYDVRERNVLIQTNVTAAEASISTIINNLSLPNKSLILLYQINQSQESLETNFYRELLYNFEHCIHHQALIKVGLIALGKTPENSSFGVAISTIVNKEKCAQ